MAVGTVLERVVRFHPDSVRKRLSFTNGICQGRRGSESVVGPLCSAETDVLKQLFHTDHLNSKEILAEDSSLEYTLTN